MSLVVRRWLLKAETWVLSHVISCEIHDGRNVSGTGFSLSFFGLPVTIIVPPLLHTYLSLLPEVSDSPE
jgi:hypothetical protein